MRKTKIVCTLGPATDREGVLRQMLQAGMNVARFNFSHGSYDEHQRRLDQLVALREELHLPVAAMLDTKGPEIRLRDFAERASMLAGTERAILQYYMDGYTVRDIPELACISASTVKTHNRNLYRKLEVDSFDELKVYIELFASCGRSSELLNK